MPDLTSTLERAGIIPVMVINSLDGVEDYAACLAEGGLQVLEITLRTDLGLTAVERIKSAHPELSVGTGTCLNIDELKRSADAGADFMVSPGATDAMLQYSAEHDVAILPGVATPSEVMRALSYGFDCLKLFPAEAVGGVKLLKSIYGPIPEAKFCPTGGIGPVNAQDYLALPNVLCVGGSWMLNKQLIAEQNWAKLSDELRALEMLLTS